MNPSKDAATYWQIVNRLILKFDKNIGGLWEEEKQASAESIHISREAALGYWEFERKRIVEFSKEQAIKEVLKASKIENKKRTIQSVADNDLLSLG